MTTSANEIIERIRDLWPRVQFCWMQDRTYVLPSLADVERVVTTSTSRRRRFVEELVDCDDFALLLHAEVKAGRIDAEQEIPTDEPYHWAFGEAFGIKVNGVDGPHSCNIALTRDAIYLIEPQTAEVREASALRDQLLLVKM